MSGSPRGGSPRGGSPRGGSPRGGSPRGGSPRGGSPRGGSPRGGSPRQLKDGSPRRGDSGKQGGGDSERRRLGGLRKRGCCPQCRCCVRFFPCFYCCHTETYLTRVEVLQRMEAASSTKTVSMVMVEDQLEQDRSRVAQLRKKWRRRWLVCGCFSSIVFAVVLTAAVVILAMSNWKLINIECDWDARMYFGATFTADGKMFIAGGSDGGGQNYADVWKSEDHGSTWTRVIAAGSFGGRHGHAVLHDSKSGSLVIIAGDANPVDGAPRTLRDVWKSEDGREWALQTASAPWAPRKFFGACVDGEGWIYVVGGLNGYGGLGLNDVWRSNDLGASWEVVALSAPWTSRHSFAFARIPGGPVAGRFYIIGGQDGLAQHDVWASDDSGITWNVMTFTHTREMTFKTFEQRASWHPRYNSAAVANEEGIVTMTGGQTDDGFSAEVWTLPSPSAEDVAETRRFVQPLQWVLEGAPEWTARRGHQSIVDENGFAYVLGGQDDDGLRRDVWKMETSIDITNLEIFRASVRGGEEPQAAVGEEATDANDDYVDNDYSASGEEATGGDNDPSTSATSSSDSAEG